MALPDLSKIPRWAVVLNLVVLAAAGYLAVTLTRELTRTQPLPAAPASRQTRSDQAAGRDGAAGRPADEKLDQYNVIVSKHLFNPVRSENSTAPTAAPAVPLPPKPVLHGIVLDGEKSRAYLEDPATKR